MADTKFSSLGALAETPAVGDLFVLVDVSDTSQAATGTPKKITRANVVGGLAASGANTDITGLSNITADLLLVGGVIVPQHLEIDVHVQTAALGVDQVFFVANRAYQVVAVRQIHSTAESIAGSLNIQITKDTSTNAPGAGTDLLTNNTNAGFDAKATANTVQTGTLTATTADLQLAAGDRLSLDFSAAATDLAGVHVTVSLKRI